MTITLPNNWRPRDYQMPDWKALESGKKRALIFAHRRYGKDDIALHWTATQVVQRIGTYWHMLPEAAQARKAIWEAINPHTGKRRIDEAFPKELRATTREQEMLIKFRNGSTWQVVGSDNFNSLVGSPPIGVVGSEWALANPLAWGYIRPILLENGGWAVFITTPRGKNHAYKLFKAVKDRDDWHVRLAPISETMALPQDILDREREEMIAEWGPVMGESLFRQEWQCSFDAAILGAYYGHQLEAAQDEGRICSVPVEAAVPVHTAWDLGMGDSTSIWFYQQVGREIRLVDFYEANGVGLDHYAEVLQNKGYLYGDHILPHDAEVRELGTGRSRIETLQGLGINPRIAPKLNVEDGINAVRRILPRCWFDEKNCDHGLECLKQYRAEYDEKRRGFRPRPVHDWTSHAADSFRYLAVALQETATTTVNLRPNTKWIV